MNVPLGMGQRGAWFKIFTKKVSYVATLRPQNAGNCDNCELRPLICV